MLSFIHRRYCICANFFLSISQSMHLFSATRNSLCFFFNSLLIYRRYLIIHISEFTFDLNRSTLNYLSFSRLQFFLKRYSRRIFALSSLSVLSTFFLTQFLSQKRVATPTTGPYRLTTGGRQFVVGEVCKAAKPHGANITSPNGAFARIYTLCDAVKRRRT